MYSQFRTYLPLEKGGALHLKKTLPKDNFGSGSGEEDENVKKYTTTTTMTTTTTDNRQSSREPSGQVS